MSKPSGADDPEANSGGKHVTITIEETRNLRNLAISSIICGLSCIGIFALINAVKAREQVKMGYPEKAKPYAHKARRLSVIAIVAGWGLPVLILLLMTLVSYLLTFIN